MPTLVSVLLLLGAADNNKEAQLLEVLTDSQGNQFEMRAWHCPTCKESAERFVGLRGGKYHRYNQGVVTRIVQCESCGLLYGNPFPYPRDAQRLYGDPEKYFENHSDVAKLSGNQAIAKELIRRLGKSNISLLDVGSGRGEMVEAARREGADAVGLEFSAAMIRSARERYGIALVAASIEDYAAGASARVFDAVVLNAVLEHVYDPDSMVASLRKLTRVGSVVYIDVPNEPHLRSRVGNAANRILGSAGVYNLAPTFSPYHVYGFNPGALEVLLKKHGFEIISIDIFANPVLRSNKSAKDRLLAFVGTQVNRLANATGTASNMLVWARRIS